MAEDDPSQTVPDEVRRGPPATGPALTLASGASGSGSLSLGATQADSAGGAGWGGGDRSDSGETIAGTAAGPDGGPGPGPDRPARPAPEVAGYEILGELGRGAMGVVYRARQVLLNRPCAVKMILAGAHADPVAALRFLAEAEAVARLRHPNVVQVHTLGSADGLPFVELEYVEGGSLEQRLDGTPWPARRAAGLVEALARGVAEAHRLGIVHRDLKPANVLMAADGTPKITDFGLAKFLESDSGLTRTESFLGTPSYMAPEQAGGHARDVGPAADVYSLGAILFELLTGRPPFKAATVLETLAQARVADVVHPSRLVPGLSRDLETIALVCLRKEPARRYASAGALADDLRRFLEGRPILARRIGPIRTAWRWCRRNQAVAGLLGAVASLLIAVAIVSTVAAVRMDKARRGAEDAGLAQRQARLGEAAARIAGENLLADMYTTRGLIADERADPQEALLWFAHAARLSRNDPARVRAARIRFATWSRRAILPAGALPHPGPLAELAYSPDGRHLLACTLEGQRFLWDLGRMEPLPWADGGGPRGPGRLAPDGRSLAAGAPAGTVEVRSVPSGALLQRIPHRGAVRVLAFSPDGNLLAIGGDAARVWDLRARRFATDELPHPAPILTLAFAPGGDRLATTSLDGKARAFAVPSGPGAGRPLFDPVPHLPTRTFHDGTTVALPLVFLDAGRTLLTIPDDYSLAWRAAETGAIARSWRRWGICSLAASADGGSIAVGGWLWAALLDAAEPGPERPDLPHRSEVSWVAFSPDGKLLTLCDDQTARFWSCPDGKPLMAPLPGGIFRRAAFAPDGTALALAQADGLVRILRLPPGEPPARRMPHESGTAAAALARDRPLLIDSRGNFAWGLEEVRTRVYDVRSGRPVGPYLEPGGTIRDAALTPDGRVAATVDAPASGTPPGTLSFWDPRTGERLGPAVPLPAPPQRVGFSPDGSRAAVICDQNQVLVVAVDRGRIVLRLAHASEPIVRQQSGLLCFTDGGDRLVTAIDGTVEVWDLASGRRCFPPLVHGNGVFGLGLAHDGRWLATGSGDHRLRVWDLATGRLAAAPMAHPDFVYQTAFSPDDRLVVAVGRDDAARTWDWRAGRLAGPAIRHDHEIVGLALPGDGTRLLTLTLDGQFRAWDRRDGKPLAPQITFADRRGGWCFNLALTADGRDVVAGAANASVAFRLADLIEPDGSAPADLVPLAELAANRRLEQGEPVGLTNTEWLDRWHAYRGRPVAVPPPGEVRAIPDEVLVSRCKSAEVALRSGDPAAALETLRGLAEARPEDARVHGLRADALARLGRWDEAAAALEAQIEADPKDHFVWYRAAPLFLRRGDLDGYRRHCRAMLARFGDTVDLQVGERVSKACLLSPLPPADRAAAGALARRTVATARAPEQWILPYALLAEVLAEARDGRPADALARADECLARGSGSWNVAVPARFLRAIALERLGRSGEARRDFAEATTQLRRIGPGAGPLDLGANWHDVLICETLRREAEVLILPPELPADVFAP